MKRIFIPIWTFILIMQAFIAVAQPCLSGWSYRKPVIITHSGNVEYDVPVMINFNSLAIVFEGKSRFDGGDIRILDENGGSLNFWIENGTYNTTNTRIWINIPVLQNGDNVVYLFYGNSFAVSESSGSATFSLFDDFKSPVLDTQTWTHCGQEIRLVNGNAIFEINNDEYSLISSKKEFGSNETLEAYVNQVSGTDVFTGFHKNYSQGYGLSYSAQGAGATMRMKKVYLNSSTCIGVQNQQPDAKVTDALFTTGIWRFQWKEHALQYLDWPGSTSHPAIRNDPSFTSPENLKAVICASQYTGRLEVDWIRVRKKLTTDPTYLVGGEELIGVNVVATSNAPVCEGENLQLSVSSLAGATYSWTGPNGFSSGLQNPQISNVREGASGVYEVIISGSGGCGSITTNISITVNPGTNSGYLVGDVAVCATTNEGKISLIDYSGTPIRWEISATGKSPWSVVDGTDDEFQYYDLKQTTYFRTVVKSGVCEEETTPAIPIIVDEASLGGTITGDRSVCAEVNEAELILSGHRGEIQGWQSSTDDFLNHQNINSVSHIIQPKDLAETTTFRAIVKNGICEQTYSSVFKVIAQPLPDVSFVSDPVCQKSASDFSNTSSISSGFITSFIWNFGDGASSVNKNPTHTFPSYGHYQTTLLAVSDQGCIDSVKQEVNIYPLPQPKFSFGNACQNVEVDFTNQTTIPNGNIKTYHWDFKDGAASTHINPSHTFSNSGTYAVTLIAESDQSCVDSVAVPIEIYPRSKVDFDVENVCEGTPAKFFNNSSISSGSLTFIWEFGDGNNSKAINPTHEYDRAGDFQVTLTAQSSASCSDQVSKVIRIFPMPVAEFSSNDICQQDSAFFTNQSFIDQGNLISFWEFGNGQTSSEHEPRYQYPLPGIYTVTLSTSSSDGCVAKKTKNIQIFSQPIATFVANPVCQDQNVSFTNLTNTNKVDFTFYWKFGDGQISSEKSPEHQYDTAGIYSTQLVAISATGCADTINRSVEVFALPVPGFTAPGVCDGDIMYFNDESTIKKGEIRSYLWSFGDGSNSILPSPQKLYYNPGRYRVNLTVVSDKNCKSDLSKDVEVYEIPVAHFSVQNVCHQQSSFFTNLTSIKGKTAFEWSFGDGNTSDQFEPIHTYEQPGQYLVTLKLSTEKGCTDMISYPAQVYGAFFTTISSDTTISKGYQVKLKAGGGIRYLWEPIDGLNNSDIPEPIAQPTETTTYTVMITDENNCRTTEQTTVFVKDDYKIIPNNVITPDGNGKNDFWRIWNIENYPNNTVQVFNRWGQPVFKSKSYKNDWYGTSGTDILPDGTYYYIITFNDTGEVFTGAINILRNK